MAQPTAVICIGMAGSGKTTFMQRLNAEVHMRKLPSYVINLDPATANLPYGANIDIRDTVNYKEVMKQYELGPNGGILTSLNLFSTKFDKVLALVDKRAADLNYILVDTPGQIEIFTWSASGAILTEALAASYPTVIAYVIDTPRCSNPATFMSNMLYASSILYKTRLPFIIVFNKTDVVSHDFAVEWMTDDEAFRIAVEEESSYMATLVRSMATVLEEFYKHIKCVGVSAMTGYGMDEFFAAISEATEQYNKEYKPEMIKMQEERKRKEQKEREKALAKFRKDRASSSASEKPHQFQATDAQDYPEDVDDYGFDDEEDEDDDEVIDDVDISEAMEHLSGLS